MSLMSRRGDTRPPTFASNGVPLESMGVCRLSLALLVLLHPTLSLGHSVLSFSCGVSNSRAPSVDNGQAHGSQSSTFDCHQKSVSNGRASSGAVDNDVAIEESMDVRYMNRNLS